LSHTSARRPSGNIYSREFILEYLLTKKKELKRQRAQYESEQKAVVNDEKNDEIKHQEKRMKHFIDTQEGIVDTSVKEEKKSIQEVALQVSTGRRDGLTDDAKAKLKDHLKSNFWVPDMTPHAGKRKTAKPQDRPSSPCTQRPLKVTGIFSLNLLKDEEGSTSAADMIFTCPVSHKQITHQKVIAIRSTGTVMLKECYEKIVKADMIDPVTGKAFTEKDVVDIVTGGTGFSGHEDSMSQATMYRPNMGGC